MDRNKSVKKRRFEMQTSVLANFVLVLLKGIIGFISGSHALLADAVHSLTDVIAYIINCSSCSSCRTMKKSGRKSTALLIRRKIFENESYSTLFTGMTYFFFGIWVCLRNFAVIIQGDETPPEPAALFVAAITLGIYLIVYENYKNEIGRDMEHCLVNTQNNYLLNKMNLFAGAAVMAGITGALAGWPVMDSLAGTAVGAIMISAGLHFIRKYFDILERYKKREASGAVNKVSLVVRKVYISLCLISFLFIFCKPVLAIFQQPWIGVEVVDVDVEMASNANLDKVKGAFVVKVYSNSPADKAGLLPRDIILSFDGRGIRSASELKNDVLGTVIGQEYKMCVSRLRYRMDVYVIPEQAPVWALSAPSSPGYLGLILTDVKEDGVIDAELEEIDKEGVLVIGVIEDSPALKAGIMAGDVIMSFNFRKVRSANEVFNDLKGAEIGEPIRMCIMRGDKRITLYPVPEMPLRYRK